MTTPTLSIRYEGSGTTALKDLRTIADFAVAAKVQPDTISAYRTRGRLPEPIAHIGVTPVWSRAQIDRWLAHRPGQGRPRKK